MAEKTWFPQSSKLYGLHIPYDKGYGVKTPNRRAGGGRHKDDWSARLIDQTNNVIYLWLEDFKADFSVSGTTAQSRFVRQFFPHSFNQVTVNLTGRVANSYEYNRLSTFVRNSQRQALIADEQVRLANTQAAAKGTPASSYRTFKDGSAVNTIRLELRDRTRFGGRNVKGGHRPWVLEGYVKSMPAGAKRHDPAPQFQFEFVVATSSDGIFEDTRAVGTEILSWMQIFKANNKRWSGGYTASPDQSDTTKLAGQVFDYTKGPGRPD